MGYLEEAQEATKDLDQLLADFGVLDADNEQMVTNYLLAQLLAERTGTDVSAWYGGASSEEAAGSGRDDRSHFYEEVSVSSNSGPEADDAQRVTFPFEARLVDLRGWSGTVYVSFDDPSRHDNTYTPLDGANAPVTELPAATANLWLYADSDLSVKVDAWREGKA